MIFFFCGKDTNDFRVVHVYIIVCSTVKGLEHLELMWNHMYMNYEI